MRRPRAYLDTNVFITALEHVGAGSDHAWWILSAIEDGEIEGATSEITLAEILVKPMERRDDDVIEAYQAMISSAPGFVVRPVERAILVEAARLRSTRRAMKLPDAVHVATALGCACTHFISSDARITVPEGISHVAISPFTIEDILGRS